MKYLKIILLIVLVLIVFFFGKGFLTPFITYESQIAVNKSVKESWAVVSDESKISEWLKSVKKIELIEGTKNTIGAVSNVYVVENGNEMVMKETITELVPNDHIAMTFTMDFMNMDYNLSMEEKDGKTIISTISTTKGNGLFAKSILSFMTSTMKTQEDVNLNNLKIAIENNSTIY